METCSLSYNSNLYQYEFSSSINIQLIFILCRPKFDISVRFLSRPNYKGLAMTGNFDEYFHGLGVIKIIAAIVNNQYEELEKLLQTDVNINEKNDLGETPLSWAACVGNLTCISKLLDLGADIGRGRQPSILQHNAAKRKPYYFYLTGAPTYKRQTQERRQYFMPLLRMEKTTTRLCHYS
jgi:hypothetical protein